MDATRWMYLRLPSARTHSGDRLPSSSRNQLWIFGGVLEKSSFLLPAVRYRALEAVGVGAGGRYINVFLASEVLAPDQADLSVVQTFKETALMKEIGPPSITGTHSGL